MNYNKLIKIYKGKTSDETSEEIKKILTPRPLSSPEELYDIVQTNYKYTGPGQWIKIIREYNPKP